MKLDKYKHFTVEDFVLDPEFKENALHATKLDTPFFRGLLDRYPEKQNEIESAGQLVRQIDRHYAQQRPSVEEKAAVYEEIMRRHQSRDLAPPKTRRLIRPWHYWAAASVLLLLVAGWLLQTPFGPEPLVYSTTFAESADHQLPDGSTVTLNANSKIRLSSAWKAGDSREVWLEGEGYFRVSRKESTGAKFVVHTSGPDIEVLGTQFNVNTRPGRTLIMLEEGKIQLNEEGRAEGRVMEAGQLADYREGREAIITHVDPENYLLWLNGYFSTDNLSLDEVIVELEYIYGVKVEVQNEELYQKTLIGPLPNNDLEQMITTFETLYNVKITKEDGTLHIR